MYCVIDIEAHGGAYGKEKIIEIAVIQYDGEKVTDQFSALVNPKEEVSKYVQKLTGITQNMLKTAPKFQEIAKRIVEITEGCTMVGHNVSFDLRMLRQEFRDLGYDFQLPTIDTLPLAERLIPGLPAYGLSKIAAALGIPHTDVHRAMGDARATLDLFRLLLDKDTDGNIIKNQQLLDQKNEVKRQISRWIKELPAERGIVYFLPETKELFPKYFSQMKRQCGQFLEKLHEKSPEIFRQISAITFEKTGSLLTAMLMCFSKHIPFSHALKYGLIETSDGWKFSSLQLANKEKILLYFTTTSQAKKLIGFLQKKQIFTIEDLQNELQLPEEKCLLLGKGRTRDEKLFIVWENRTAKAFGFYSLFHQIKDWEHVEKRSIAIPTEKHASILTNEILLQYLTGNLQLKQMNVQTA